MRWDDVRMFLGVARTGSLSGAARELGCDHSTVYRRIQALERAMGVPLFDRAGGRYALTGAGLAAFALGEDAEEAMSAFQRGVASHDERLEGMVHLHAPESMLSWLTPHLHAFRQTHPKIVLRSFFGHPPSSGGVAMDVSLRLAPRTGQPRHARAIGTMAWAVYASTKVSEVEECPWVGYASPAMHAGLEAWTAQHLPANGPGVMVHSIHAMAAAIVTTGGRGLLPCIVGDAATGLRRRGEVCPTVSSTLWLVTSPEIRGNACVHALSMHLKTVLHHDVNQLQGGGD